MKEIGLNDCGWSNYRVRANLLSKTSAYDMTFSGWPLNEVLLYITYLGDHYTLPSVYLHAVVNCIRLSATHITLSIFLQEVI